MKNLFSISLGFIYATLFLFNLCVCQQTCSQTCLHNGFLNTRTCTCICQSLFSGSRCEAPNFTCDQLVDPDPNECDSIECSSDSAEFYCPKKCYCEQPSVLTNNCEPCMNGGQLDTKTCKCSCKENFTGSRCQFTPDPCEEDDLPECSDIDCWSGNDFKFFKCQKKCLCCGNKKCTDSSLLVLDQILDNNRVCKCENYTTTPKSTAITHSSSTTTTVEVCNTLICKNGGQLNADTCQCSCMPAYTGALCETIICEDEPGECDFFSSSRCSSSTIFYYCPRLCGICTKTTMTTTTTSIPTSISTTTKQSVCVERTCNNGFSFNVKTCECNCLPGFYGNSCQFFNCSYTGLEDVSCRQLDCGLDLVKGQCPFKCFCNAKPMCLPCYNNGKLDLNTCGCTCAAGFKGERCEYAIDPCDNEDNPEYCSSLSCWDQKSDDIFFNCQRKCLCCGNKKCYNYGRLRNDVKGNCDCECPSPAFDEATDCKTPTADCEDTFPACLQEFGKERCLDQFVFVLCPKMCGFCDS